MHHFKVLVPLLFFFANGLCQDQTYCNIYPTHTLCVKPPIGPSCRNFTEVVPTSDQITNIVHWHNKIRQKIALGNEPQNNLPTAANMMKMEWDPELARIAQRAANQCVFKHDCNKCRRVLGGRFAVGQSIAYRSQSWNGNFDFVEFIKGFYEKEVEQISQRVLQRFYSSPLWSHYSQIIWWNTRAVGCGGSSYSSFNQQTKYHYLVVCNYGTTGNIPLGKIYSIGEKCTRCPGGTVCDATYDGLCAIHLYNFYVQDYFQTDQMYLGFPRNSKIEI